MSRLNFPKDTILLSVEDLYFTKLVKNDWDMVKNLTDMCPLSTSLFSFIDCIKKFKFIDLHR